ncbi:MAG TPA: 2-amino-4-hydroxy-6-hydroxymethyldihydropteridine diphosphokinase [Gemmatimonadaceae bacterium]
MPERVLVALGSNVGDREGYLASARALLGACSNVRIVGATRVEETAPLGGAAQAPYLNQMVLLATRDAPLVLLARLHRIEMALGRVRAVRWSPRTIDLDIVRFGEVRMTTPRLTLPHPGLKDRGFWQRQVRALERHGGAAA